MFCKPISFPARLGHLYYINEATAPASIKNSINLEIDCALPLIFFQQKQRETTRSADLLSDRR